MALEPAAAAGGEDKRLAAADALEKAEELADALELQNQLRQQVEMERSERQAMSQELSETREQLDGYEKELSQLRARNAELDLQENERHTIMQAKADLEEELLRIKQEQASAVAVRSKAEQDLEFEQEV